jgi:hypothetical protein
MSNEEPNEINFFGNLFIEERVQFNIKGLIVYNLIERKMGYDLSKLAMVQMGDNDLLMRQLVKNQHVSPNYAQSNNISVNLITCVNFLRQVCPKSYVILQASPLFAL